MVQFDSESFSKEAKIARYAYKYDGITTYESMVIHLKLLEIFDLGTLQDDRQKLAFWINVYNGMTNYAIIKWGIKVSMKENPTFFKNPLFKIGDYEFSLDDIEHGILRRNARKHLEKNDPKLQYMVGILDYRIHFALNCGAVSCPAIAFYTLARLEEQLEQATQSFVTQEFHVHHENKTIHCSSLFEWYKMDFENQFLNNPRYKGYSVLLKEYDWSV